ncbi:MAG: hypothetical protein K8T90_16450 [Planctomycetes bacterium]|nr:hypothetical protein [Planctomycetota bacterium]
MVHSRRLAPVAAAVATGVSAVVTAGVTTALACAVAVRAGSARADDTVDLQVVGNANVAGTIRPAGERERFLFDLGMGTKIAAAAKAKSKRGAFIPQMDLTDPGDAVLATATVKGRGSKLASFQVPEGGRHALRVFGDGAADGDYTVAVTLKPQKAFSGTGTSAPSKDALTYTFGAPAGTKARVVLKAGAGRTFVPVLDSLDGPRGEHLDLTGASTRPLLLTESGDWTVGFHDGGAAGGGWVCQVILTLPKLRRSKIDISAAALTGNFADQQPVYGRLVDDGGALIDPPDTGGSLDGASVSIPAGGMPFPVVITMSPAPSLGGLGGDHPAGPAIQFGPPGTKFNAGKSATISLPYDASRFSNPATELTVYVEDESTGLVTPVPKPYNFDTPGVVSFPAPHFSIYMAGSGAPRPLDGRWVVASFEGETSQEFGAKSQASVGTLEFYAGNFNISTSGRSSTWTRLAVAANGPVAMSDPVYDYDFGSFTESGTSAILYPYGGGGTDELVRAAGGDVLLRKPAQAGVETLAFALREAPGIPTFVNVAGRYTLIVCSRLAESRGGAGMPDIRLVTEFATGTAVLREDGTVSISVPVDARAEAPFPTGSWRVQQNPFSTTGVMDMVEDQLSVRFAGDSPDGQSPGPPVRLRPCLDGEVLLAASDASGDDPTLFIFVREGRGVRSSLLTGVTAFTQSTTELVDAATAVEAPRMTFSGSTGTATFKAPRGVKTVRDAGTIYGHDQAGAPTSSALAAETGTATFTLSSVGAYRSSDGFVGAVSQSGRFIVGVASVRDRQTIFTGIPGADLFGPPR